MEKFYIFVSGTTDGDDVAINVIDTECGSMTVLQVVTYFIHEIAEQYCVDVDFVLKDINRAIKEAKKEE